MSETAEFWRGDFGDAYTERHDGDKIVESNINFFNTLIFAYSGENLSFIEFGANRGLNLRALHELYHKCEDADIEKCQLAAVEINAKACEELRKLGYVNVFEQSMLDENPEWGQYDYAFTKGVLIHIHPDDLPKAYEALYNASRKYIMIAEYYNPIPVEVEYRGNAGKLWKRDFASEMMEKYPDLELVYYEFFWHKDDHGPQDDITAFLLRKRT